jgi:hypothetical protein
MAVGSHRFSAPRYADKIPGAYVVHDANGRRSRISAHERMKRRETTITARIYECRNKIPAPSSSA